MLSKCANPECSEPFLRLQRGKLFHLSPTPEVRESSEGSSPDLYERFWLCDRCCKEMTVVWAGDQVKLERLPSKHTPEPQPKVIATTHPAFTGRDRG